MDCRSSPFPLLGISTMLAAAWLLLGSVNTARGAVGGFEAGTDVGKVEPAGKAQFDPDKQQYRITASGENIWKTLDAFHFVHQKISGNLTLTADIEFVGPGKNAHRKAGCMIRQGLEADAAYVDVMVHGDGLIALQYRSKKGEATSGINAKIKAPAAVRLERHGNTFTVWAAPKGGKDEAFQPVGSIQVELADSVYVGLAVCSHDPAVSETAVFSKVTLKNEAAKPATTPGK